VDPDLIVINEYYYYYCIRKNVTPTLSRFLVHSYPLMKGGNVTSAGWQVTLCDPIWHVSSRSGVATLRTAIHLLLIAV